LGFSPFREISCLLRDGEATVFSAFLTSCVARAGCMKKGSNKRNNNLPQGKKEE
jgi:hypothetical protein